MTTRRVAALCAAILGVSLLAPLQAEAGAALFHPPIAVLSENKSSNWSGYNQGSLEKGGELFTSVSGRWMVPKASQHRKGEAEYSSTWIGIGGGCVDATCTITDTTLIQEGT